MERVEPPVAGARTELRIQIAAVVRSDGRLEDIVVLTKSTPAITSAAVEDLASWEFKPASRDGAPIAADVVLEIPFSFSPQLATRVH
jgi:outer membrane biosynthesis protein TonB